LIHTFKTLRGRELEVKQRELFKSSSTNKQNILKKASLSVKKNRGERKRGMRVARQRRKKDNKNN
jgi:hypothetical protein